jgi:hypothetical protein
MKKLLILILFSNILLARDTAKRTYLQTRDKIDICTLNGKECYINITPKSFYGKCLSFYDKNTTLKLVCDYQTLPKRK